MRRWGLLASALAVFNLVSWSALGAVGLTELDLKALQEDADAVLLVHVERIVAEHPWNVAQVRCAHALKGKTESGAKMVIRYPDGYPNDLEIFFGLQNGGDYLVFLGKPAADGVRMPAGKKLSSWPVPAIAALPESTLLRSLGEIAVLCAATDEGNFHETGVALANGLHRLPDDQSQDRAQLTLLVDNAIRARCEEMVPPPYLAEYIIGMDLYSASPEVLRKALFHVRRASWDKAYKAVDIRHKFGLVRNPALKDSMLCLMSLGDAKVASFAASSIRQWGDRDCVPFAIEVLRSQCYWEAANVCDRFLYDLAVKEPNVPEAARLRDEERPKLQETIWSEKGLRSAEERNDRAEYWEKWWKAVWVKNKPKADQAPREGRP